MHAPKSHRTTVTSAHPRTRTMALAVTLAVSAFGFAGVIPAYANDGGSHTEATAPATTVTQPAKALTPLAKTDGNSATGTTGEKPDASRVEPVITTPGLTGPIISGDEGFVTVTVSSGQLGSPVPTGQVLLAVESAELLVLDVVELVDGQAILSYRPMDNGKDHPLSVTYLGDDFYADGNLSLGSVEVHPAYASLSLSAPERPVYAGGQLTVDVTVTSEDSALYGDPDGTVALTLNGKTVGTADVVGSADIAAGFAEVGEDLSAKDANGTVQFQVTNPELLLGSSDTFELRAHFTPKNGFTEATQQPTLVKVAAAPTMIGLHVGSKPESATTVTDPISVSALVTADGDDSSSAANISGMVHFFAGGVLVGESAVNRFSVPEIMWTPTASGAVQLSAEFVPDTLNHTGSTQETSVTVELPTKPDANKPDETTPVEKPDTKPETNPGTTVPVKHATAKTQLAETGADGAKIMLGGAGTILGAGLLALFVSRRRSNPEQP